MCCRVATCCFVRDLRLATLIIAVISLLGNAGVLAFTAYNIKLIRLVLRMFLAEGGSGEKDLMLVRSLRVGLAIAAVALLMSIAAILLDIVLFFGAFRRRRDMVQCWSHGHAVVSGAYLVYFWLQLVDHFAAGLILYGFMYLGATLLGAVVTVYFWIVVRSYDLKLHRTYISTVSGNGGPSGGNSHNPASSRQSAPYNNGKILYSPPPYSSDS